MFKEIKNFNKWSKTEKVVFVAVVFLAVTHLYRLLALIVSK